MIDYLTDAISRLQGWWGCANCEKMHRRAQAAESAAAKAIRQNDHAELWKTVDSLRRWRERDRERWIAQRKRVRIETDKIRASGLVDPLHPGTTMQTGYLDILVDRLIAAARDRSVER